MTPPPGAFVEVVSGRGYSCARSEDGAVACFGPRSTAAPDERFVRLAGGHWQTACGITHAGDLACWGDGHDGLTEPPQGRFKDVLSCGTEHCCALRGDDVLECWGSNAEDRASSPTGAFTVLAAGRDHTCGVRADGTACWGSNSSGQANVPQTAP